MRIRTAVVTIAACALAACASQPPQTSSAASAPLTAQCTQQIADVVAVGKSVYQWRGNEMRITDLEARLKKESKRCHIAELRLYAGAVTLSMQHVIEIGMLADVLKAKPYYERDGKLNSINYIK